MLLRTLEETKQNTRQTDNVNFVKLLRIFPLLTQIKIKFEIFNWCNTILGACYTDRKTDVHRTSHTPLNLLIPKAKSTRINKLEMKGIYNVGNNRTVIRRKAQKVYASSDILEKLSVLETISSNPKEA